MLKTILRLDMHFNWFFQNLVILILLVTPELVWSQSVREVSYQPVPNSISSAALLLEEYVRIPSETGNENNAAYFLMQQCMKKGLIINKITDSIGCVNFAASVYPLHLAKPNIIFLNHIDVVHAGDPSEWTHPPYEGCIDNGKVWGRGALDNKGLAIIQLSAIGRFIDAAKSSDLPYNITLLCVSGEETGGAKGSAIVSKNFNKDFNPVVVIGEGGAGMDEVSLLPEGKTFFGISVAEKGLLWLQLSFEIHGAGHSSIAGSDYSNKHLILGLHKLVNKRQPIQMTKEAKLMFKSIGKKVGGFRGLAIKHLNWLVFRPFLNMFINKNLELEAIFCNTITVSNMRQPDASFNQNMQEATAYVDCRLLPGTSPTDMIELIRKKINDSLLHISIVREGPPQFSTHPEFFYDLISGALQKTFAGSEVVPILFPASNDNSYFRAAGCPVYGLNPMIISRLQLKSIHNYNEYIDLEDIDKGIEVYESFLRSVLMLPTLDSKAGL